MSSEYKPVTVMLSKESARSLGVDQQMVYAFDIVKSGSSMVARRVVSMDGKYLGGYITIGRAL